jgi:pimeloyl-ACP methyl ester carboxylesterase
MKSKTLTSVPTRMKFFIAVSLAAMLLGLCQGALAQVGLTTHTGTFADGATYLIEVPRNWNGTLFLYSHGYNSALPNPPADSGDPLVRLYLLSHGYALAGSSYSSLGWAIHDAFNDQIAVLDKFDHLVGQPSRTIAWGHSLGGFITAGLVQKFPHRFSGALPLCGGVAGAVGFWNQWLDSAFAFKTLLASGTRLQLVHITDPVTNLGIAMQFLSNAQTTLQGQARIALVAALFDLYGWIDPFSPPPADYASQEANQFASLSGEGGFGDFQFFFAFRAELEKRAGGNPSWNTGVDYEKQLKLSIDYAEVQALYKLAGLNLDADLKKLNKAARIPADPAAVSYLSQNIIYDGEIKVPVLTAHTTSDDAVVVQNEQAYASVVHKAHDDSLLRETFVHRAGHCSFTPAETIAVMNALIHRLDAGEWKGVDPEELNQTTSGLAPVYNFLFIGAPMLSSSSFVHYAPAPFLRPFDAFDQDHGSH